MDSFYTQIFLIFNLAVIVYGATVPLKISCRDESGQPIDWYILKY